MATSPKIKTLCIVFHAIGMFFESYLEQLWYEVNFNQVQH